MSGRNEGNDEKIDHSNKTPHETNKKSKFLRRGFLGIAGTGITVGILGTDIEANKPTSELQSPEAVIDADWTMWRFNRANTGENPHSFVGSEFSDSWEYSRASDRTLYSPAVADGTAYFGAFDNRIHAVDTETGEELWTATAGDIIQSTPTILENTVYAAAYDGRIYAWDTQTGEEIWSVVGGGSGERTTSVTVSTDEETIIVGSDDAVYSLVPETGDINWEFATENNLTGSPSVEGGVAYQGDWSGNLYAIDVEDGEEVWSRQLGSDIRSTAAVVDGVLYLGVFSGTSGPSSAPDEFPEWEEPPRDDIDSSTTTSNVGEESHPTGLYALDTETGDEIWRYEMDATVFSSPAVAEGLVYVADYSGKFVAVDQDTGDLVWSHQLSNSRVTSSPAYADGLVYVGSGEDEGALYVFDAQSGEVMNKVEISDSEEIFSPAVGEDMVYVTGSGNATLYGYRVETEDRGITGTVTGPDGEAVVNVEVFVTLREQEHVAIDSILSEYPDHSDPATVLDIKSSGVTNGDGVYSVLGIDRGTYHLLVLPETSSGYEPVLAENVTVTEDETERDIQLAQDRPLAELDDIIRELIGSPDQDTQATVATPSSTANSRGLVGEHLETITEQTAQVTTDGIDEAPDAEDFVSIFNVTDSALDYDLDAPTEEFEDDLRDDIIKEGLDLGQRGLDKVLETVWDQLEPEFQDAFTTVTGELDNENWFVNLEWPDLEWLINEGYMQTPLYTGAMDQIGDARSQYDAIATQEPAPDFSSSAAKEILEEIKRQIENPNYGPPGYVSLPNPDPDVQEEELLEIDQSGTYEAAFRGTENRVDDFDTTATVAQAGKVVGGAMILTGKGAPVGAKVMKLSAKSYKAAEFAATIARIKLLFEAILTNIHWGLDTGQTADVSTEMIEWLDMVVDNPEELPEFQIKDVDMNLTSAPIAAPFVSANEPQPDEVPEFLRDTDFFPIERVGIQTKAVYDAEITIENITQSTQQFEIIMYNQYDGGQKITNEATLFPDEGEVAEVDPGDQTTVELEYVSDYNNLSDLFNLYTMNIEVWSEGSLVDFETKSYRVLPGIGIETIEEAVLLRNQQFVTTRGDKAHDTPITTEEFEEISPRIETVLEETVTPDSRVESIEVTADEDTNQLAFLLTTTGRVALQVFDEQGRQVGFDPDADEVLSQIPDATYVGPDATPQIVTVETVPDRSYTVQAVAYRFVTGRERSITIHRVDIPQREALLSVSPDEATTTITPGEKRTTNIYLSETGEQVDVEDVDLDISSLTDDEGNELVDVKISPVESNFTIPSGEIISVDIEIDADAELSIPNAPKHTRFDGDITIETDNAGSLDISLSALVLATELQNISLHGADPAVDGVEVSETPVEDINTELPVGVEPLAAYTVEAAGSGRVDLKVPRPSEMSSPVVLAAGDDTEALDAGFTEEEIEFGTSVETASTIVLGNLRPLANYANEDGIIKTDALRDAIDDWTANEIETDLLQDVIDVWTSGDPI